MLFKTTTIDWDRNRLAIFSETDGLLEWGIPIAEQVIESTRLQDSAVQKLNPLSDDSPETVYVLTYLVALLIMSLSTTIVSKALSRLTPSSTPDQDGEDKHHGHRTGIDRHWQPNEHHPMDHDTNLKAGW
jgi:hypothetical protein